jgi:hypothetical protein
MEMPWKRTLVTGRNNAYRVRPSMKSIDEIITSAKLRPTFYYHFTGGKEELQQS